MSTELISVHPFYTRSTSISGLHSAQADVVLSCHHLRWFHQLYCVAATFLVTGMLSSIPIYLSDFDVPAFEVLLVIRTHALYERSRSILILLCSIVLCGAAAGCVSVRCQYMGKIGLRVECVVGDCNQSGLS